MIILQHIFRYVLLVGIGIVLIWNSDLDDKFSFMIGWIAGVSIAYAIGVLVGHKKNKRKTNISK
ncbi:MAG: hypothetical protein LBR51_00315 [Bacteroidales bacterium]|jgi:hypothetical protein|nr:hypothetical protein [Bacteroidales bacterium]